MTYLLAAHTAETQSERQYKLKMLATAADNWNRSKPVVSIPTLGLTIVVEPCGIAHIMTDSELDEFTEEPNSMSDQLSFYTADGDTVTTWFEEDHLMLCIEREFTTTQRKQFVSAVKAQVGGIKSIDLDNRCNCYSVTFRRAGDIPTVKDQLVALAHKFASDSKPEAKQASLF